MNAIYNNPAELLRGIKMDFYNKLKAAGESVVKAFTFMTKSETLEEVYPISDIMSVVKEWVDEVNLSTLNAFEYRIRNKKFAGGLVVDKDILDDGMKTLGGGIEISIRAIVDEYITYPDKLIANLLTSNGNAFDGTAFFANDRPLLRGDSAIDNITTGTGITLANISADYASAKSQLLGNRDRNGDPFNKRVRLAVYSPVHLLQVFEKLRTQENITLGAQPETNIYRGDFDIIPNYNQASGNGWFLINTAHPFPAFIFQIRKEPEWKVVDDPESTNYKYITNNRMNAGYGNPMAIVQVTNS